MYDICHPTYYHMSQQGCTDQIKLTSTFYAYIELCEVKRYWNVEYFYNQTLQTFYLKAKRSKNSHSEIFIPWPTINNITISYIRKILDVLNSKVVTFIFKEGDSSSVYYSMSSGIAKPGDPEKCRKLKFRFEKKRKLQLEIRKNSAYLYDRALDFDPNKDQIIEFEKKTTIKDATMEPSYLHNETFLQNKSVNIQEEKNLNSCSTLQIDDEEIPKAEGVINEQNLNENINYKETSPKNKTDIDSGLLENQ